ncbi:MarR family winged helix-turn-helix transcriptional regulator [Aliikangiella sp. G2MR2-5]|uniref:MarR family winged helix-turn-helix transcriptional regulator n=1 Tax=Aliikangiella sp. G2MR2-5 TaxID=2788943 RepID=UPI0018AC218C|nr:MarR family transcriptional regulator [Aliikangiella sp. G2MR2-5]
MKNELVYTFERLANLLKQEARTASTKSGLQAVQYDALLYLSRCNRFSNTPIAVTEYLGLTKGTVSQTIKVLERKGYVTKVKDKEDKRLTHLNLTSEGAQLISSSYPPPDFISVLDNQSKSVQALLSNVVHQLLSEYRNASDNRAFGECRYCIYHRQTSKGYRCSLLSQPLNDDETLKICREFSEREVE